MTDRELLEFAAKAVGIEVGPDDFTDEIGRKWAQALGLWVRFTPGSNIGRWWNPLTDDGDALRLAVKLSQMDGGVALMLNSRLNSYEFAQCYTNTRVVAPTENMKGDPYAATRRAIVRAAAEIGKALP